MNESVERTAVVLSAGGERVIPWEIGVLAGFAEAGMDLRRAAAIAGTSAGSLVAARLALGIDQQAQAERIARDGATPVPAELLDRAAIALPRLLALQAETAALEPRERSRRIGRFALGAETIAEDAYVEATSARVPEGGWPAALRLMAVDARSGGRVELTAASGIAVGRGVAAARAVPGVLPPVGAGERQLIDAVIASGTNADAAALTEVERVLVITAATAEARPGTIDSALEAGLEGERNALLSAGLEVDVVRADREAHAAMGEQLYGIVDATAAVASGRRAGRSAARQAIAAA